VEHNSIIGLDIAKSVFQVHRQDASGGVIERRRLRRSALLAYFAGLPRSCVGLEACASAHHWARSISALGHEVRLIAPSYVKPYVQRQKNDAADAAAIAEALTRPHMRFVPIKTVAQQGALMLHRVRDLLIKQRTMTLNALRAHLAELGLVSAKGRDGAAALVRLVEADAEDGRQRQGLDALARSALLGLVTQLRVLQGEIAVLDRRILAWHRENEVSQRLASIPGIGVLSATALAATIGDGSAFQSSRQLAAWLGLVPRQNSSGGKERLGKITKQGDPYLRRLLVIGATSTLIRAKRGSGKPSLYPWAAALLQRKPYRLVTVALANKMARIVWAVLSSGQLYRPVAGARI
jgi:transposase